MRSTLSQTLPQNCRVGVDNYANRFVAVHAKLGRYCRRRHRCEYFAPVWGSLYTMTDARPQFIAGLSSSSRALKTQRFETLAVKFKGNSTLYAYVRRHSVTYHS